MPPDKHPDFLVRQPAPLVGGPPLDLLVEHYVTPVPRFFVRDHARETPAVDGAGYRLTVGGLVRRPLVLTLAELRRDFPRVSVTAALQCAGNRRRELMDVAPIPGEVPWGAEAVGNAVWTGAPLAAVLAAAGVERGGAHVELVGLDRPRPGAGGAPPAGFGGSVPLAKALGDEVLLADEMNGEPLAPRHGAPLRAVVPGYIGARSVKWVEAVTVRAEPTENYYQRAYSLHPPDVTSPADADPARAAVLDESALNCVICTPADGATLHAGAPLVVRGYALTGGGRTVAAVELSADGGRSWRPAALEDPADPWAWRRWRAEVAVPAAAAAERSLRLVARARDSSGTLQPADPVWNFKGYMHNAWHAVEVTVG